MSSPILLAKSNTKARSSTRGQENSAGKSYVAPQTDLMNVSFQNDWDLMADGVFQLHDVWAQTKSELLAFVEGLNRE